MKTLITICSSLVLCLIFSSAVAISKDHDDHEIARQALLKGEVMPLKDILALAERYVAGDIIEVELEEKKGKLFYEFDILTPAGGLIKLVLDAKSGNLIKMKDD